MAIEIYEDKLKHTNEEPEQMALKYKISDCYNKISECFGFLENFEEALDVLKNAESVLVNNQDEKT